jgi:Tfp pilus assembly protein PilE
MTKRSNGFTVIELVFIIVIAAAASIIFFIQKNNIQTVAKDDTKKTAINSIYYSLEEVYYKQNSYYPQTVDSATLPSVDPALFTDPSGITIGTAGSAYQYNPVNCSNNQCKSYTLKAALAKEADYIKTSRNN